MQSDKGTESTYRLKKRLFPHPTDIYLVFLLYICTKVCRSCAYMLYHVNIYHADGRNLSYSTLCLLSNVRDVDRIHPAWH